jgi:hypothetical protein
MSKLGLVERLRNGGQDDLADMAERLFEALELASDAPKARGVWLLDAQDMECIRRALAAATKEHTWPTS